MKKLIVKSVLMVGVMLGISNYMLYIMTGKSPFSGLADMSFNAPTKEDVTRTFSGGKETVYKWTDEKGAVHYSSEPPESHVAQTMEVDPDVNLIKSLDIAKKEGKPSAPQQTPDPLAGGVYNPAAVQKLMQDAKNVQTLLNERNEATEKALENL